MYTPILSFLDAISKRLCNKIIIVPLSLKCQLKSRQNKTHEKTQNINETRSPQSTLTNAHVSFTPLSKDLPFLVFCSGILIKEVAAG